MLTLLWSLFIMSPWANDPAAYCSHDHSALRHIEMKRVRLYRMKSSHDPEHFPLSHVIRRTSREKYHCQKNVHCRGCSLKLNSCSTNSPGDDQLFPAVGTGWLSVPLCVQHVLFNPAVYHKVLAVSLENPPLLLVGVSQFLGVLVFSAGLGGDEISNPAESLQQESAFNYWPLLRAEVRGQEETVHESP